MINESIAKKWYDEHIWTYVRPLRISGTSKNDRTYGDLYDWTYGQLDEYMEAIGYNPDEDYDTAEYEADVEEIISYSMRKSCDLLGWSYGYGIMDDGQLVHDLRTMGKILVDVQNEQSNTRLQIIKEDPDAMDSKIWAIHWMDGEITDVVDMASCERQIMSIKIDSNRTFSRK